MSNKQYGLILKGKNAPKKNVASVFNDDSSGDEETKAIVSGGTDWMKRKLTSNAKSGATGLNTKVKAQTKIEMKRAMEEDPTVYQYDEVYDQMEAAKTEQATQKKDVDRKPKYITNLLKMAEVRNKENERRIERQVQKEREAEGDEFADKEKFVTSAYRKKMEEMQKLDEEERKQEAIENLLDVTKQKDMSGFYRHLYRQTMGEEKGQKELAEEEATTSCEDPSVNLTKKSKPSERSYRNRDASINEDEEPSQSQSQSSGGESDSSDQEDDAVTQEAEERQRLEKEKARREELKRQKEKRERRKRRIAEGLSSEEEDSDAEENTQKSVDEQKNDDKENLPVSASPPKKKEKRDIWKKVTVGDKFDEALQRYLMRKAERGSRFPW